MTHIESRGFTVAFFKRTTRKVEEFFNDRGAGKSIIGTHSVDELCASLAPPPPSYDHGKSRRHGRSRNGLVAALLAKGNIAIDGSSSYFADNIRRTKELEGVDKCAEEHLIASH